MSTRVLFAEDDSRIAGFVARGLREERYDVDVAGDGDEALRRGQTGAYDLAILDVMMPGQTGFEVCRELRRLGKHMPILMLTARDGLTGRIAGLDQGADDYLTKPFEFRELLARLRALRRRSSNFRPSIIVVADLTLDTIGQTASRSGRRISLAPKQYALLEFLARQTGRMIGRAEIAEHVWDERYDPFSNLIEVYMNRVRRKVDWPGEKQLLHTRRGAGYMLGLQEDAEGGGTGAERDT